MLAWKNTEANKQLADRQNRRCAYQRKKKQTARNETRRFLQIRGAELIIYLHPSKLSRSASFRSEGWFASNLIGFGWREAMQSRKAKDSVSQISCSVRVKSAVTARLTHTLWFFYYFLFASSSPLYMKTYFFQLRFCINHAVTRLFIAQQKSLYWLFVYSSERAQCCIESQGFCWLIDLYFCVNCTFVRRRML